MNFHAILSALVAAALAVAPFLSGTAQTIVSTIAGVVGTFVVRPSQLNATLGKAVAKMPGKSDDSSNIDVVG